MHQLAHQPPRPSRGFVRAAPLVAPLVALLAVVATPAAAACAQGDGTPPPPPASASAPAPQLSAATRPKPSPALTPERVIAIQLDALQHNDTPSPDFGIETTFRFASPANRGAVGPLDRFTGLVKTPAYRAMINHVRAEVRPVQVDGDRARERVTVVTASGVRATYLFFLSRQQGGQFDGCWMTDGVTPVNPDPPLPHGMRAA
jgi:hypothetical protein